MEGRVEGLLPGQPTARGPFPTRIPALEAQLLDTTCLASDSFIYSTGTGTGPSMQDYVRTYLGGHPVEQCMSPKGDRTGESLLSQHRYSKCWWCEGVSPELLSVLKPKPASEPGSP